MSEADGSPSQLPPPLKLSCTSSDCAKQLHCFRATKKLCETNQEGRCRSCGADLIDWSRVHRRDLEDADFTFESLRRELVRHHLRSTRRRSITHVERAEKGFSRRPRDAYGSQSDQRHRSMMDTRRHGRDRVTRSIMGSTRRPHAAVPASQSGTESPGAERFQKAK